MYRLVLYGLIILACYSILAAFIGGLAYSASALLLTLLLLILPAFILNLFFAKIFKATINIESSYITALILFFLVPPVDSLQATLMALGVSCLAVVSKFIFTYRKKHIFNPAALAVFVFYFLGYGAFWWIATPILLPPTLILGLLVVRKIRRFSLLISFLASAILVIIIFALINKFSVLDSIAQLFLSWPLIFFGTIMLTEPLTTPPTRRLQMIYGGLVGVIFSFQLPVFGFYTSPEFALLIGNIFSFAVSPKGKMYLTLKRSNEIADHTYEFVFATPQKIAFRAGQYLEWTLSQYKTDTRGNRRYFTIASSPADQDIKIAVRMNEPQSSFKNNLKNMKVGDKILAGSLAGDFTVLKPPKEKFVFIAGGIGITPFRSIVSDLVNTKDTRSFILFYANKTAKEIAYKDFFDEASKVIDLKVYYSVSDENEKNWGGIRGRLSKDLLIKLVPDLMQRIFYLSGPELMVEGYKKLLLSMNVSRGNIKTDYFPGF